MSAFLMLRFRGVGVQDYHAVNERLGIDVATGSGDWPQGLVTHVAGIGDGGDLVVAEVWESRDAQMRFMQGRLGTALADAAVPEPAAAEWVDLEAHVTPQPVAH